MHTGTTPRWKIELVFRQLKTHLRILHLASARPVVVESLVCATMIGLAVSRALWRSLRNCVNAGPPLSGEGADPNLSRLTLKRGWAC